MSTVHGPARTRTARRPPQQRPLSVVPRQQSAHRPRAPFVVLLVALLAVGLVGLLLINTSMQRKAFELTDLRERAATLEKREQALQMDVERLSSPDRIAAEAGRLGMVPNASPAFLRLEDGEVVGQPRPAMPGTNLPGLSAAPSSGDPESGSDTSGDPQRSRAGDQNDRDRENGGHHGGDDSNRGEQDNQDRAGNRGEERR